MRKLPPSTTTARRHPRLTLAEVRRFQRTVREFYDQHGRDFPWRRTQVPYRILVSEVMLQQTQTARVALRYPEFLRRFPSFRSLANASIGEVVSAWSGLGYNRRALALRRCAIEVCEHFGGRLPSDEAQLRALPGIGAYTAAAVRAFAFNLPTVMIETNIRAVMLHHFFEGRHRVSDQEIREVLTQVNDEQHPRTWYYALMDYGVALKSKQRGITRRSSHYRPQSRFKGSVRELRGRVLALCAARGIVPSSVLEQHPQLADARLPRVLEALRREGFLQLVGDSWRFSDDGRVAHQNRLPSKHR